VIVCVFHEIRRLILLLLAGLLCPVFLTAQGVKPNPEPVSGTFPGELKEWMSDIAHDSIPLLSQKKQETKQFRLITQAVERYLERRIETEKVAAAFIDHFHWLQKRFNSQQEPNPNHQKIAEQVKSLMGLEVSIEAGRLVWTCRNARGGISLRSGLVEVAEVSTRKASRLLGTHAAKAEPILWYLWVESCLDVLDSPFNHYVYSNQLAAFGAERMGKTFGPGLFPELSGDRIIAKDVFDPALTRAGLVPGSELTAIDGHKLTAEKSALFKKWLQPAVFSYQISFRNNQIEKTVKADSVPFRHPTLSWTRRQDIVYMRLSGFSRASVIELRRMFRLIQPEKPLGLIIDLRENPGGVLNFDFVDCFFKPGQIIGTFQHLPGGKMESVGASIEYYDIPLVLLVNRHSASMSEVFAAAVSVHKRGIIIGEKTYGKGVGQRCQSIGHEGELCLVETRYYYPGAEKTWNGEGITPDITIKVPNEKQSIIDDFLSGAILDLDQQLETDVALSEAVRVLREKKK
jgi:carboxyl-terminal processing protease